MCMEAFYICSVLITEITLKIIFQNISSGQSVKLIHFSIKKAQIVTVCKGIYTYNSDIFKIFTLLHQYTNTHRKIQ
jgi:hypothetical protein